MRAAAVACALALTIVACGGSRPTSELPDQPGIEDLRRRARERPDDPNAQRALALAEAFMPGGDASRVTAAVERALALDPDDERLLLLAGLEHERHGAPELALDRYLAALEAARESEGGDVQYVAELAAFAVAELRGAVPGYVERTGDRLDALLHEPGALGAPARHTLGEVLIESARRRGDLEASAAIAEQLGCPAEWRAAGPFGPHELLGFDRALPPEKPGPLADRYDLGRARGRRATRTLRARGCAIRLDDGPLLGAGTSYAEAQVEVPRAGRYVLRVRSQNAVAVFVDDEEVLRLDHRREPEPWISYHRVRLDRGRHRVMVKIATRFFDPSLRLSLVPPHRAGAFSEGLPRTGDPWRRWLRAAVAWGRRDVVEARRTLSRAVDSQDTRATAPVLELAAAVAEADPLRTPAMQASRARALWALAAERDPAAWQAHNRLAWLDAQQGLVREAIDRLREASGRWPKVVRLPLGLATLYDDRGWDMQMREQLLRAHRMVPEAVEPLERLLKWARERKRVGEVQRWLEPLMQHDVRRTEGFELLADRRRWDRAETESARLAELEPPQHGQRAVRRALRIARGRGDGAAAAEALEKLRRLDPRESDWPRAQADRLAAKGHTGRARALLGEAIDEEPTAMADLRLRRFGLGGELGLDELRVDGDEAIRRFERSRSSYPGAPEVLVLDHTVMRVFEDGSYLELTHQIRKLETKEAVERNRMLVLAEDALLLGARTVKASGRHIEIDGGKDEPIVRFPEVQVGDYVEHELVRHHPPEPTFSGGVATWRFFFGDFRVAFHDSRFSVLLPEAMEPVIDRRGGAPEAQEEMRDGSRVLRWRVEGSAPIDSEPMSVDRREYIPSVRVSVEASWQARIDHLRDRLADRDVRDPVIARLAREIAGSTRNVMRRAKRIYGWVLGNVEHDDNTWLEQAAPMVMARRGHRIRVLRYMLHLADVPAQLVLARPVQAAGLGRKAAEKNVFSEPVVMIPDRDRSMFLSMPGSRTPFGYVPGELRGQQGVVVDEEASRVTVEADVDELHAFEVDLYLREDGSARGEVVETFRGWNAIQWRERLPDISMETLKESLQKAYVSRLVPGATLETLDIEGLSERDAPLVFEYVFFVDALGHESNEGWLVPGLLGSHIGDLLIRTETRDTTQVVIRENAMDVTLRIHPPSGVDMPPELEPVELEGPNGARFRMTTEVRRRTYLVERELRVPVMRIEPAQYDGFKAFCRGVEQAEARDVPVPL